MSTGLIGLTPEEEALLVLLREAEGLTGISHDEATALPHLAPPEAEGLMDISNGQASHAAEPAGPGVQYRQQLDVQVPAVADVASRLSAAAAHVAATEEQLVAAEARVATAVAKAEASPRLAPAPAWRPSQRVTAVVAGLRERRQIAEAELELQRTVLTLTLTLPLNLPLPLTLTLSLPLPLPLTLTRWRARCSSAPRPTARQS